MSKAEERAFDAYPDFDAGSAKVVQCFQRQCYINGYEQAEKDLALTWEDIQRIWQIIDIANEECDTKKPEWMYGSKSFFSEVLRRFEEGKKNSKTK